MVAAGSISPQPQLFAKEAKMFSDHVAALRARVAQRKTELYQRELNEHRWSVRRNLCALADNRFLAELESAIGRAYQPSRYRAVLRTYTWEEVEAPIRAGCPPLGEVLTGTDVLDRVGNCLAPGFFKCTFRREQLRGQPEERFHVEVTFVAEGFEAPKPPCTCVLRDRTVGFCEICGGHGNRAVVNPEEED